MLYSFVYFAVTKFVSALEIVASILFQIRSLLAVDTVNLFDRTTHIDAKG